MFRRIRYDINAYKERDPAARSGLEVLLLYPGLHAVINHRVAHFLYRHKHFFTARAMTVPFIRTSRWVVLEKRTENAIQL